jgi:hypothetical protein
MAAKLILTWDIKPDSEQEYFEFVVREFLPEVQKFGFTLSDAWVTVFGDQPQILVGATLPDVDEIKQIIHSEAWGQVVQKLMAYVTDYHEKIMVANGGFQF